MDTKRLIITIVVTMALMTAWNAYQTYIWSRHPEWKRPGGDQTSSQTTPADNSTTGGSANSTTNPASTQFASATTGPSIAGSAGGLHAVPASQPTRAELGSLENKSPTYAMGVSLSAVGAGIEQVTLNDFKQSVPVGRPVNPYVFQEPYPLAEDATRSLATRAIVVDGQRVDLDTVPWQLLSQDTSTARFAVDLADPTGPVLHVTKTYTVPDRTASKSTNQGYELNVEYAFQNVSARAVGVRTIFNGPTMPPREIERGADRSVVAGYNDDGQVVVAHNAVEEFTASRPTRELAKNDKNQDVLWAGAGSVYFDAIVRPVGIDKGAPWRFEKVTAEGINPAAAAEDRHVALTFETNEVHIAPGETSPFQTAVLLAPKKRDLLQASYFSAFPLSYDRTLVMTSGMCGICAFGWLINLLVMMLSAFHFVLRDWGLAIICLVLVVRACLHPITKRSQISMMKMGKMGPEMEKLKKKYGDDKDALNKAMMQFYKEQGFTPVLGCLPMFLQMPIWIALWNCLQSTFELRQEPFLYGLTWIHDLAKPDSLISFAHPIPLPFGLHLASINILPMVVAVITFFNQKYMPKPAATTPEQEQQQKMMQWMSLMFPLMFYALPSGLNLYYVTSMGLGMLESKIIRDHIKEREAAKQAGRVLVDTRPTRAGKKAQRDKDDTPKSPPTGLMKWFAELQAKAEQMRRNQD